MPITYIIRGISPAFRGQNADLNQKEQFKKDDNKIGLLLCHSHIELRLILRLRLILISFFTFWGPNRLFFGFG